MLRQLLIAAMVASAMPTPAAAAGPDRKFIFMNESSIPVIGLHMSNVDDFSYSEEYGRVGPGESMAVVARSHNGYCRFDMLISFEDQTVAIDDVDLCGVRAVRVRIIDSPRYEESFPVVEFE